MAIRLVFLLRPGFVSAAVLCVLATVMFPESRAWDDPLTPSERMGRTIYHQGRTNAGEEVRVSLAGSDGSLSATLFRCVQCHGMWGQGGEEGGLRVPPLFQSVLTQPHTSLHTGQPRGAYTDQSLIRAMTQGVDVSGALLHPGMPRYHFTKQQADAMVAYLKKIGTEEDSDPGITKTSITVGAALPLSGPLAGIGQDARAVIEGMFRDLNDRGGVYGRQIRLVVEDAGSRPSQLEAATARLIKREQVFALVGSLEFGDAAGVLGMIEQAQVPLIGPLALSPQPADPPNPYVFYTLPGFDVQYCALLDFVVSHARSAQWVSRPRVAIVRPKQTIFINRILTPSRRKAMDIVVDYEYVRGSLDRSVLGEQLQKRAVQALVFIGDGEDFFAMIQELERRHLSPLLLTAAGMVGHHIQTIPSRLQPTVFLSAPIQPPTEQDREELQKLVGSHELRNLGFARMAKGSAFLLCTALMQSGRRISRGLLAEMIERVHDQETGAGFSLTYGPQRRVGSLRVRIFGVRSDASALVPVTDWMVPQESEN